MSIPTMVNNFSTTLALPHAIGDGVLAMRPGAGDLIRSRLAEIGAPDISADAPIRVMAASRKSMQANVAVPASQWTIFEATGLTGDDLTGCSPVEGTADFAYEANDPLVAGLTAGTIKAIRDAANTFEASKLSGALPALDASATMVTSPGSTTARSLAARFGRTFQPEDFGALADNSTDNTAAFNACLAAWKAAGGGTIELSAGTYRILGKLTIPNTPTGDVPTQPALVLRGSAGAASGRGNTYTGGSFLDLRYAAAGEFKLNSLGVGSLAIYDLALIDGGTGSAGFLLVTNTTTYVQRVTVVGNKTVPATCNQIGFRFGNPTNTFPADGTGAFQGYGSFVRDCEFDRLETAVILDTFANNFLIDNVTTWQGCGTSNAGRALIEVRAAATGYASGVVIRAGIIEMSGGHQYGVKVDYGVHCIVDSVGFYDPSNARLADVWTTANSLQCRVVAGFGDDANPNSVAVPTLKDDSGGTTFLTSHQGQPSVYPQPAHFTNASDAVTVSGPATFSYSGGTTFTFGLTSARNVNIGAGFAVNVNNVFSAANLLLRAGSAGFIIKIADATAEPVSLCAGGGSVAVGATTPTAGAKLDVIGVAKAAGYASAISAKAAAYTLTTSDSVVTADATSGAFAVTLPAAGGVLAGRQFTVKKTDAGANAVTLTRAGSDTIDGATTYALGAQNKFVTVVSNGTSAWWVVGTN